MATVRRQSSAARRASTKYRRKYNRLTKHRANGRLTNKVRTSKQRTAVAKLKSSGFYKRVAALRSSTDIPFTLSEGTAKIAPAFLELVIEAASEFDDAAEARDFAAHYATLQPWYSGSQVGLCALALEAYMCGEAEEMAKLYVESILEPGDNTFLVVFQGQLSDQMWAKFEDEVDFADFDILVEAGDVDEEDGSVSDLTIVEVTPRGDQAELDQMHVDDIPGEDVKPVIEVTEADYRAALKDGVGIETLQAIFRQEVADQVEARGTSLVWEDPHGVLWTLAGEKWLPLEESITAISESLYGFAFDKAGATEEAKKNSKEKKTTYYVMFDKNSKAKDPKRKYGFVKKGERTEGKGEIIATYVDGELRESTDEGGIPPSTFGLSSVHGPGKIVNVKFDTQEAAEAAVDDRKFGALATKNKVSSISAGDNRYVAFTFKQQADAMAFESAVKKADKTLLVSRGEKDLSEEQINEAVSDELLKKFAVPGKSLLLPDNNWWTISSRDIAAGKITLSLSDYAIKDGASKKPDKSMSWDAFAGKAGSAWGIRINGKQYGPAQDQTQRAKLRAANGKRKAPGAPEVKEGIEPVVTLCEDYGDEPYYFNLFDYVKLSDKDANVTKLIDRMGDLVLDAVDKAKTGSVLKGILKKDKEFQAEMKKVGATLKESDDIVSIGEAYTKVSFKTPEERAAIQEILTKHGLVFEVKGKVIRTVDMETDRATVKAAIADLNKAKLGGHALGEDETDTVAAWLLVLAEAYSATIDETDDEFVLQFMDAANAEAVRDLLDIEGVVIEDYEPTNATKRYQSRSAALAPTKKFNSKTAPTLRLKKKHPSFATTKRIKLQVEAVLEGLRAGSADESQPERAQACLAVIERIANLPGGPLDEAKKRRKQKVMDVPVWTKKGTVIKRLKQYESDELDEAKLTTQNQEWGFYGTVKSNYGLSNNEAADAFNEIGQQLVKANKWDAHHVRRLLDSKVGRHLADELSFNGAIKDDFKSVGDSLKATLAKATNQSWLAGHYRGIVKTKEESDNYTNPQLDLMQEAHRIAARLYRTYGDQAHDAAAVMPLPECLQVELAKVMEGSRSPKT